MGWTAGSLQGAPFSAVSALTFEFGTEDGFMSRLVKASRVGSTIYAAVRSRDDESIIWGLVLLTQRESGTLYTKPVDEIMGPNEIDCPASVLALLTPTNDKYALAWRAACRESIAKKARIHVGTTIRLAAPMMFSDEVERDTFTKTRARGNTWRAEDGSAVKLPAISQLAFEMI